MSTARSRTAARPERVPSMAEWLARKESPKRADSFSMPSRRRREPLEKLSSCRVTVVLRRAGSPAEGRVVRVPCKYKDPSRCLSCAADYQRRKVEHFSALVAGLQLHELTVTAEEWGRRLRKRLSGRADYVRVPVDGGRFVVLTTASVGEPVADPVEAVTIAMTAMVVDGRNITSSRAWAESNEHRPSEWERVAVTVAPVAEVARAFADYRLLRGKVRSTRVEAWDVDLSHGIPQALAEALDLRPPPRRSRRLPMAA